jgi:hypothetical protein
VFIEEGLKYSGFGGWGCGGPLCNKLAEFGGERAAPALERVFRHYESQGCVDYRLIKTVAELKGECIYIQGGSVFRERRGVDGNESLYTVDIEEICKEANDGYKDGRLSFNSQEDFNRYIKQMIRQRCEMMKSRILSMSKK